MDFFGLDIGSVNIKLARLTKKRSGFKLESLAVVPTPTGGLMSENEASLDAVVNILKSVRNDAKISVKNVVAALPESEVFTRILTMPKMSVSELETAISWEAEQYIPLPLTEVNYSYSVVGTNEDGSMEVAIVAAPLRLVEKYELLCQKSGLNLVALETGLFALARATGNVVDKPVMIADMGARTVDICVAKAGSVLFTRSVGTGGGAFTRALMTNLQLDEQQAESFKRTYGFSKDQMEGKMALAMEQVYQSVVMELQKSLNFYATRSGNVVTSLQLMGGCAVMPDLVSKLANDLRIEVQVGNAMAQVDDGGRSAQIENLNLYGTAAGLAMKSL